MSGLADHSALLACCIVLLYLLSPCALSPADADASLRPCSSFVTPNRHSSAPDSSVVSIAATKALLAALSLEEVGEVLELRFERMLLAVPSKKRAALLMDVQYSSQRLLGPEEEGGAMFFFDSYHKSASRTATPTAATARAQRNRCRGLAASAAQRGVDFQLEHQAAAPGN